MVFPRSSLEPEREDQPVQLVLGLRSWVLQMGWFLILELISRLPLILLPP